MTYGSNIRAQVFEVIVRQAIAGAPWRIICAGPMQVNNISEQEIEDEVYRRVYFGREKLSAEQITHTERLLEEWNTLLKMQEPAESSLVHDRVVNFYRVHERRRAPDVIFCSSPQAYVTFRAVIQYHQTSSAPLKTTVAQLVELLGSEQSEEFQNKIREEAEALPPRILRNGIGSNLSDIHTMDSQLLDAQAAQGLGDDLYNYFKSGLKLELNQIAEPFGTIFNATLLSATSSAHRNQRRAQKAGHDIPLAQEVFDQIHGVTEQAIMPQLLSLFGHSMQDLATGQLAELGRQQSRSRDPLLAVANLNAGVMGIWRSLNFICWEAARQAQPDKFRLDSGLAARLDAWIGLLKVAPWYFFFEDACFVGSYPKMTLLDDLGRLSNRSGPAVVYNDGYEAYGVEGVILPKKFVLAPESITVDEIEHESNIAVRRMLMESYGLPKFLKDSNAKLICKDECGELYRKDMDNDEPLLMVRVINSTMEADGSHRNYFLRVPPSCTTAKEAVAWSFSMDEGNYQPEVET